MKQHCIYLKLEHPKLDQIQNLREQYDPLASKIPPHVTVVFPFETTWALEDMKQIIDDSAVNGSIEFSLGLPAIEGEYLHFPIVQGRVEIISLHKNLYRHLNLEPNPDYPFHPHVTFAKTKPDEEVAQILWDAQDLLPLEHGRIRVVVLEEVGLNQESVVLYQKRLGI